MTGKIKQLLTIDVNAHLQKLAAYSFKSKHHYPVELVRTALKRNAKQIKIVCKKSYLQMVDTGSGIQDEVLRPLMRAMNSNLGDEVREKAIADLRNIQSVGLFALFTLNPDIVTIENVYGRDKRTIVFQKGKVTVTYSCSILIGTKIKIVRTTASTSPEITAIKDFCRGVDKTIVINGKPIGKRSLLSGSLVYARLKPEGVHFKTEIGIPKKGDVCKIWLLDSGIPWSVTTHTPVDGYIFDAVFETQEELSNNLLQNILPTVQKLYERILDKYPGFSSTVKSRIEELVFKHFKLTQEPDLINRFSLFEAVNVSKRLSIRQLQKLSRDHIVYAIGKDSDTRRYNTHNKLTLKVNPRQRDFLMNHLGIPLQFLAPINSLFIRIKSFFWHKWYTIAAKISRYAPGSKKVIALEQMAPEEKKFLSLLWIYLNQNPRLLFLPIKDTNIQVLMIESTYFTPSYVIKKKEMVRIFIRRNHPLTRSAITSSKTNPDNIELFAHLLL